MAKQRYVRFWSKKSIVSLIGIDYTILEKSGNDNLGKFYIASFLVLVILGISFMSVFYAFDLMFNMWHAEILLSSFFSLMFFTIYIFLIQTFSKELFPTAYKVRFFNLSNLSRVAFVFLIGFLIAQPIKIFVLRHQLDSDVEIYKNQLYLKFCKVNANLYATDLTKLNNQKLYYQSLPKSSSINVQIKKINNGILEIGNQISSANNQAKISISNSNFFIKRIEMSNRYSRTSIVTFLILTLFFTPILLIYSISGTSKYYKLKKTNDKNLVDREYAIFKYKYSQIFKIKHKLENVEFHEPFSNPPFNTIRKPDPSYLSQKDFFDNLMSDERL